MDAKDAADRETTPRTLNAVIKEWDLRRWIAHSEGIAGQQPQRGNERMHCGSR